jgi:acyl-CoA synthetase (NDP forming)
LTINPTFAPAKTQQMLESELYDWLNKENIRTPKYKVFSLAEEPDVDFYPVALKIQSPKVVHKSDAGAVVTDVKDRDAMQAAKATILANIKAHGIALDDTDHLIATQKK